MQLVASQLGGVGGQWLRHHSLNSFGQNLLSFRWIGHGGGRNIRRLDEQLHLGGFG